MRTILVNSKIHYFEKALTKIYRKDKKHFSKILHIWINLAQKLKKKNYMDQIKKMLYYLEFSKKRDSSAGVLLRILQNI